MTQWQQPCHEAFRMQLQSCIMHAYTHAASNETCAIMRDTTAFVWLASNDKCIALICEACIQLHYSHQCLSEGVYWP